MLLSDEYEVGGGISASSPLMKGGGYALKLPVIDIAEVGAGGGSIVRLDKAVLDQGRAAERRRRSGPRLLSAGGDEPTVTDANVVLGFLNREALCGGTVPIDAERSRAAIMKRIAEPLGRSLIETAYGIHLVANANMMRAIKAVTTYRGRDPRDFSLYRLRRQWRRARASSWRARCKSRMVIVPPAAGVFSAIGLLTANVELMLAQALPVAHARDGSRQGRAGLRARWKIRSPRQLGYRATRVYVPARRRPALRRPGLRADGARRRTASSTRPRCRTRTAASSWSTSGPTATPSAGPMRWRRSRCASPASVTPEGVQTQRADATRAISRRADGRSISVRSTASATRRSCRAARSTAAARRDR